MNGGHCFTPHRARQQHQWKPKPHFSLSLLFSCTRLAERWRVCCLCVSERWSISVWQDSLLFVCWTSSTESRPDRSSEPRACLAFPQRCRWSPFRLLQTARDGLRRGPDLCRGVRTVQEPRGESSLPWGASLENSIASPPAAGLCESAELETCLRSLITAKAGDVPRRNTGSTQTHNCTCTHYWSWDLLQSTSFISVRSVSCFF